MRTATTPNGTVSTQRRLASAGTAPQPSETTGDAKPAASDGVADSGCVETPFGAPVVRDLPADPGPHERLLTVREVASRLGVSSALVYKLCERNLLRSVRIGGALRFQPEAIREYLLRAARR